VTTKEVGKAIVERREQRKEPPPPPALLPIEPAVRFGTWTQVFGDYQKRDAAGPAILNCCTSGNALALGQSGPLGALGAQPTLALNIDSRTSTVGFVRRPVRPARGVPPEKRKPAEVVRRLRQFAERLTSQRGARKSAVRAIGAGPV
jgi:hypothetical protein